MRDRYHDLGYHDLACCNFKIDNKNNARSTAEGNAVGRAYSKIKFSTRCINGCLLGTIENEKTKLLKNAKTFVD